jgi:hypothetical protein
MADHFWLSDSRRAVIEPHIPKVYTGKRRVDDRRVISGIDRLQQAGSMAEDPGSPQRRRRCAGDSQDRFDLSPGPRPLARRADYQGSSAHG